MNIRKYLTIFSLFVLIFQGGYQSHAQDADVEVISTSQEGQSARHNNMQPYIVLQYAIATSAVFSADGSTTNHLLGEVAAWPYPGGNSDLAEGAVPGGWTPADGRLLPIANNTELFEILGTTYGGDGQANFALPDLRGRTPVGIGSGPGLTAISLGEVIGSETVRLSEQHLAAHSHDTSTDPTPDAGGSETHPNRMPGLGLRCLIATSGGFPPQSIVVAASSTSKGGIPSSLPFIAEMRWYAGNVDESSLATWEDCDGELLSIPSNTALFSLLGTNYGGNATTNFAVPDMRGRVMVHHGTGPGLTEVDLGEKIGIETVTLTTNQIPAHSHTVLNASPPELTTTVGGDLLHSNRQPLLGISHLLSLSDGIVPSTAIGDIPMIGRILYFGGSFEPRGYQFLNGQQNTILDFPNLHSLIGDTYGGTITTFSAPDARGRVLLGNGTGNQLSARTVGEKDGSETHTLSLEEMPRHRHGPDIETFCWATTTVTGTAVTTCL
ncbi:MAG: tail fiber protein [Pseudomonadota bacterium]